MAKSETTDQPSSLSRFLPTTEAVAGKAPKARLGRPPKVRHDIPDDVPVDGDYRPLELINQDPAFDYAWMSDADRESVAAPRGYVAEAWGPNCCRPKHFFGKQDVGTEIKQRELTLHKVPKARIAKIRAAEAKVHTDMARSLMRRAAESGPRGRAQIVTTHELPV